MNTTAGSHALVGARPLEEAHVAKRLRGAGAIILGKTNVSEWSSTRGRSLASGWSGRGGQTTNAYFPGGSPGGSSSGSAVATSIGLATASIGAETDCSIIEPAAYNNVVGLKPTVGLTSRSGAIPNTTQQDSIGPMARTVADTAILLSFIAGKDPADNHTLSQPEQVPNYADGLDTDFIRGKRIGVPRKLFFNQGVIHPAVEKAFQNALEVIRTLGGIVVDPADLPSADILPSIESEEVVALTDLKIQVGDYLRSLSSVPSGVRSLDQLIEYNKAHSELELPEGYTDQDYLLEAVQKPDVRDDAYWRALAYNHQVGREKGIDAAFKDNNLDVLLTPACGFASHPSALAGYPILTVPMGFFPDDTPAEGTQTKYPAPGFPIGLAFLGRAFSEHDLLKFGYAYEQKTQVRLKRRAYAKAIPKAQLNIVKKPH